MQANSAIDTTTTKMAIGIITPSRACPHRPRAVKDRSADPAPMGLALGRRRRGGVAPRCRCLSGGDGPSGRLADPRQTFVRSDAKASQPLGRYLAPARM